MSLVETQRLGDAARKPFTTELSVSGMAVPELYGSKLVAAMGRQHSHDLFDVHALFARDGLTSEVVECIVCYGPDSAGGGTNWNRDAEHLLKLHRDFGINYFKLDAVNISSPAAAGNFRHLLDALLNESRRDRGGLGRDGGHAARVFRRGGLRTNFRGEPLHRLGKLLAASGGGNFDEINDPPRRMKSKLMAVLRPFLSAATRKLVVLLLFGIVTSGVHAASGTWTQTS